MIPILCASIMFIQSGYVAEPYKAFDIYWQDYAIGSEVRRLHAVAIAGDPHCANLARLDNIHNSAKCDTFIPISNRQSDALALSKSLADYPALNVIGGLPYCEVQ